MSVSSPCEICTVRDVQHTCDRCGQLVCGKHFDEQLGYCVECAGELGDSPNHIPDQDDMPDDVDTYQF